MRFHLLRIWFCVLFMAATLSAAAESAVPADVIVINAHIYTVDPQQAWGDAIAVRGDHIVAVGDNAKINAYRGKATKVIDAHGRLVLPGFTDCHIHFMDGSLGPTRACLNDARTGAATT